MKDVHVLPQNDLREHDESRFCWCMPRIEIVVASRGEPAVVIHNSADGRELVEEHGIQ